MCSFWIEPEQADGLKAIRDRDGILPSEQIRRAIADWFKKKGRKPASRRVSARRET